MLLNCPVTLSVGDPEWNRSSLGLESTFEIDKTVVSLSKLNIWKRNREKNLTQVHFKRTTGQWHKHSRKQPNPSWLFAEQTSPFPYTPWSPHLEQLADSPSCIPDHGSASGCTSEPAAGRQGKMKALFLIPGAAMEKSYASVFLLLMAISCVLAKDIGKKETKETSTKPKLPQTLSRGKNT